MYFRFNVTEYTPKIYIFLNHWPFESVAFYQMRYRKASTLERVNGNAIVSVTALAFV